jgi:hypothetical protein
MKSLAILLFVPLCLLHAETAQERGKRVVMDALQALGGDKFLAMNDRVESGRAYSFYRDRLTGLARATIYTRYLVPAKPGSVAIRERQMFGKDQDFGVLFLDNGEAWEITFRGARPLAADRAERRMDTTLHDVFYILRQRLNEPGLVFESQGAEVVDNVPVEVVDITDSNNETTTVYFHQSTKLPMRQKFYRRDKERLRHEETTVYSKYREVSGVQWPWVIQRERDGEKVYEIYSDSVEINKALPDTTFQLPSDIKKLKPS